MNRGHKFRVVFILYFIVITTAVVFCLASCGNRNNPGSKPFTGKTGGAKYVFLFIGDGMSEAQVSAAEIYKASITAKKSDSYINPPESLHMKKLGTTGFATTFDAGSYITDSASAGTALACGYKTLNGVIGKDVTKTKTYMNITEAAKKAGMKVGIVSSVSIDHATPAAFYAKVDSREMYYEIGMALAQSGYDYFAGGGFRENKYGGDNKGKSVCRDAAVANGYTFVNTRAAFDALTPESGKVLAVNSILDSSKAMPYELIRDKAAGSDDISLAEYTRKGIELLDNDKGFFMMVEGGKIDWACHANDAAASIHDTLAFDEAIGEALKFYEKHPKQTLIVVTGDHECGGLTMGFAGTGTTISENGAKNTDGYFIHLDRLSKQTMSYDHFDKTFLDPAILEKASSLKDLYAHIEEAFGLDLDRNTDPRFQISDYQLSLLEKAFIVQKKGKPADMTNEEFYLLYGGYMPLSVTITHVLNQVSGVAWTSYSHTGVPVPVYARGISQNEFEGFIDNTDICKRMSSAMGLDMSW